MTKMKWLTIFFFIPCICKYLADAYYKLFSTYKQFCKVLHETLQHNEVWTKRLFIMYCMILTKSPFQLFKTGELQLHILIISIISYHYHINRWIGHISDTFSLTQLQYHISHIYHCLPLPHPLCPTPQHKITCKRSWAMSLISWFLLLSSSAWRYR